MLGFLRRRSRNHASHRDAAHGPARHELEDSPLVRRLERLDWPSAPPEVKERSLQEILRRLNEDVARK